ncbi:MAG: redox-regulated ATPase YchF [Candidatus Aenigmarchaeota archaeon]|nr:redox-regulated ATPase YchF [Candidatus Aenigmarchaeota archaeon]
MAEIGLVGAPSSGKSTFFKACTLKDVKIAPYPFTTLEPNEGLAYVRAACPCLNAKTGAGGASHPCGKCISGVRFVPIKLWDVAGLVPDAHKGRGRGNAFLSDVMRSDALVHVVDMSGTVDYEGNPASGFDPMLTVEMLEREVDYWLLSLVLKDWKLIEVSKEPAALVEKRLSGLGIQRTSIDTSLRGSLKSMDEQELLDFVSSVRKKSKPILIAGNKFDMKSSEGNVKEIQRTREVIQCSAEVELALREAAKEGLIEYVPGSPSFKAIEEVSGRQKDALGFMKNYLDDNGSTGVQQCLDRLVFDVLGMVVVFPVEDEKRWTSKKGEILPDAFIMRKGSTAVDLAYRIHQDIGSKFISAINAKTGRSVSSDYVLQNGDVISIKSGR